MSLEAIVVAAWLLPMVLFLTMVIGFWRDRKRKKGVASQMIIQITTIGNAQLVNNTIRQIHGYGFQIPYQIWVVIEPFVDPKSYSGADRVIVVPREFTPKAKYKARALEYSRRVREEMGLSRHDVKILFLDDDVLPSKRYIQAAFDADYDVCQGVITPKVGYRRFLGHLDDLRLLNCLMFCSVFQGFGQPLWVHGEGLCVRGDTEQLVTWDYPVFASEDLVFGHMARHKGARWGFFHEHIYITSPWTLQAFFTQRRRWLWGNIHAFRYVLPIPATLLVVGKYILGFVVFFAAIGGVLLDLLGMLDIPTSLRILTLISLAVWLGTYAYAGWVNSGKSVKHALISLVLAWITAAANILVIIAALAWGNPKRFDVIEKVQRVPSKSK